MGVGASGSGSKSSLGGPSSNGQGKSTRDKNLDALGDIAAGRTPTNSGPGGPVGNTKGAGSAKGGTTTSTKKKLPPGLNPLKYNVNPTQQFKPTAENLINAGTLVGDVLSGPAAIGLEAVKSELGLSPVDNMLDPFHDRLPDTTSGDYDKSESVNASTGSAQSPMGNSPAGETAEQKKKKKVATKPGFNLLTGAGGTLLGS